MMLENSVSAATFFNDMGDLLVGYKDQIFYIDHSKCKQLLVSTILLLRLLVLKPILFTGSC